MLDSTGRWRATGAFDAQNSFGAKIRGYFVCDVQRTPNGTYDLVSIAMK